MIRDILGGIFVGIMNTPKFVWLLLLGPAWMLFAWYLHSVTVNPSADPSLYKPIVDVIVNFHGRRVLMIGVAGWAVSWGAAFLDFWKNRYKYL